MKGALIFFHDIDKVSPLPLHLSSLIVIATMASAVARYSMHKKDQVVSSSSSFMPSTLLASSISISILGCGLVCTLNEECNNLSTMHSFAGACLCVLSFLPVVFKWLELRRSGENSMKTKESCERSFHRTPLKGDDNKTQDTRSTCSWYSSSRRSHGRQTSSHTASSHHDDEFLNSIRNRESVLDCQSHSSEEAESKRGVTSLQEKESWLDEVVVTNAVRSKQPWLTEVAGGDQSINSSFEESRHPLSPTGYISLVKAFSSHSMGTDDDCLDTKDITWDEAKNTKRQNRDGDSDMILNQLSESLAAQMHDESEHSSLNTTDDLPVNTKDVLSGMLEETINQMQESSKRMREAMKGRVNKLTYQDPSKVHADCRDDLHFGMASSACGTFNLNIMNTFPADTLEPADSDEISHQLDDGFASSPYALKRSLPMHGATEINGDNASTIKQVARQRGSPTDKYSKHASKDSLQDISLPSASSMLSAPDDEKQQDAQVTKEEDVIVRPSHTHKARKRDSAGRSGASFSSNYDDSDLVSITHSLSTSIKKGVQCHGGIESVVSKE